MNGISEIDETIPVTSGRLGSWCVSISRSPLSARQLANRYDAVATNWQHIAQRYQLEQAYQKPLSVSGAPVALSRVAGDAQVLDCGVGSGSLSVALHRLLMGGADWYGIDTSSEMLVSADALLQRVGISARLEQADVQAIPYEDASFDMVMAAHVLEHLPRPERALAEMLRVLKPGGRLFVCMTRRSLFGALIQMRWRTWAVSETQGICWLRTCRFSDIGLSRIHLGGLAGWASTAFWARRPH